MKRWIFLLMFIEWISVYAADPVVSNVRALQRADSKVVAIRYDVADADGTKVEVSLKVTDGDIEIPVTSLVGDVGENIRCGKNKYIEWNAGADWNGNLSSNVVFAVTVDDGTVLPPPRGMVLVPGGTKRGTDPDFGDYSLKVETFYLDSTPVTKAEWDEVLVWARAHGYVFDNLGQGQATNHPVQSVNWYDCLKWCNARTEMENALNGVNKTPCYTVSGSVYRRWQSVPDCNFSASGYRLPTSEEWEYAARGGLSGKRFPWGNFITHDNANYFSDSQFSYDTSLTRGYHPMYNYGGPYTSPVRAFAPNGYGLYDMAGNVWEWCWDASGSSRAIRGGAWFILSRGANFARCGSKFYAQPYNSYFYNGFRAACR